MEDTYRFISNIYGMNLYKCDKPLRLFLKHFTRNRNFSLDLNGIGEFAGRELYEISDYI